MLLNVSATSITHLHRLREVMCMHVSIACGMFTLDVRKYGITLFDCFQIPNQINKSLEPYSSRTIITKIRKCNSDLHRCIVY